MSTLKPGWVDQFTSSYVPGTDAEPTEWKLWRARGEKPFKRPDSKMRESARRGADHAHNGSLGMLGRKLVKVLGKVDSDD